MTKVGARLGGDYGRGGPVGVDEGWHKQGTGQEGKSVNKGGVAGEPWVGMGTP